MLPYGFCTLAQLKSRLGVTDSKDDAVIQEIINGVAGAMEAVAGRTLRRDHYRTEVFNGGESLIRLGMSHAAKVHSVRESVTRDFETAGEYEELVEGTDWVLEDSVRSTGRLAGETGMLRRLNGRWERGSGTVRVVYTGGFKTDEERAMSLGPIELSSAATVGISGIERYEDGTYKHYGEITHGSGAYYSPAYPTYREERVFVRFGAQQGALLPAWDAVSGTLRLSTLGSLSTECVLQVYLIAEDPLDLANPARLFGCPESEQSVLIDEVWSVGKPATGWKSNTENLFNIREKRASIVETLHRTYASHDPFVAFCLVSHPNPTWRPDSWYRRACVAGFGPKSKPSDPDPDADDMPRLELHHGWTFVDPFFTPDDLRHANLLQAVHEYQTRKSPGMISQYARGAASATGGGYMKTANMLLPEVAAAAARYRRII